MARRKLLTTVVAAGDIRASLEALRDRLAAEIEEADGKELAPLAKQLSDVLHRIESLPRKEASRVDDLARRRADRLPGASVSSLPEGQPVSGQ